MTNPLIDASRQDTAALQVTDLTVTIRQHTIIEDCSFAVQPGRTLGLLGPNGTGKTTLLRTIAGILAPERGEIAIHGHQLHELRPLERARLLTYVGQDEQPPADLTVAQAISMGRLPYRSRVPWRSNIDEAGHNAVAQAAHHMRLEDLLDAPCHKLSGGQRRRVILARGLAQTTPVILFDEPTNHLDIRHQLDLLGMLRETDTTVVCSLHDVDLAYGFCDDVAVIQQGRLHAFGDTTTTLAPDLVRKVFAVRSSALSSPERTHLVIEAPDHQ